MIRMKNRILSLLAVFGVLGIPSLVHALTFKGVVSDTVNRMPIDSVTVSMGGAKTLTDSKGAFTLEVSANALEKIRSPHEFPFLKWNPGVGLLFYEGNAEDISFTVHSLQGSRIPLSALKTDRKGSVFSIAHLQPGIYLVTVETHGHASTFRVNHLKNGQLRSVVLAPVHGSPLLKKSVVAIDYVLTFSKGNYDTLKLGIQESAMNGIDAKMKSPYPMRNILHLFTNPLIPDQGPNESATTPKCANSNTVEDLIGGQLSRHNFVFIGENHRRINLVINGKVAWHYDTENDWEDDEVWVLSNGNVLHAHMKYIEEVTPMKQVVWRYDNPAGTEIHTCQPIGIDKVLFLQNEAAGSRVRLYNKVTKIYEIDKTLKEITGGVHGQCRRLRMTAKGTFIAATMGGGTFYEYDKDFNVLWSKKVTSMWGGVPLKNGNFLYQMEGAKTSVEMNRAGETVWQASIADIQPQLDILAPGMGKVTATQTCERLSNGNTVILTRFCDAKIPQAIEITPDKKVVWILKDWKNLGDGVSAQFLDEPGYPELPGATNH